MITRLTKMTWRRRFVSSALLIVGIALVFAGFGGSLGFTSAGILAGAAAIAALLYAGAVWFGGAAAPSAAEPIVVFDRALRVVCGAARGCHVSAHFPDSARGELERCCAAALAGDASHFTCGEDGHVTGYDLVPVLGLDGAVPCGIVIAGTAAPAPAAAACIAN